MNATLVGGAGVEFPMRPVQRLLAEIVAPTALKSLRYQNVANNKKLINNVEAFHYVGIKSLKTYRNNQCLVINKHKGGVCLERETQIIYDFLCQSLYDIISRLKL